MARIESFHNGPAGTAPHVVVAESGGEIMLADAAFVNDAKIMRDGQDLLLQLADGQTVIIENYFAVDMAPSLAAPNGVVLTPALVQSFVQSAQPRYASLEQAGDESAVGIASEVQGEVTVTRADGSVHKVINGTAIFQGDVIETGAGGAVNIVFIDETNFAIADNARLAIDEYVFDPDTATGVTHFSVLRGMFVFSSGLIGREDPDDVEINTPMGSIGIRGTTIAGNATTGEITLVEGAIVLRTHDGAEMTLAAQFETARFDTENGQIQNMGVQDSAQVAQNFAAISGVNGSFFAGMGGEAAADAQNPAAQTAPDVVPDSNVDAPAFDTPSEQGGTNAPAQTAPSSSPAPDSAQGGTQGGAAAPATAPDAPPEALQPPRHSEAPQQPQGPVNQAPVTHPAQSLAVDENAAAGHVVGTIMATDPEGDTLSFSITGGNAAGLFAIDANGVITVTGTLDYETHSAHSLTVAVSDGTNVTTVPVTIIVGDIDDTAPQYTIGQRPDVPRGETVVLTTSMLSINDPDSNPADVIINSTNSRNVHFTHIGDTGLMPIGQFTYQDVLDGKILLVSGSDAYMESYIDFTVRDGAGNINPVQGRLDVLVSAGTSAIDLYGTDGNDTIIGNANDNIFYVGRGVDSFDGGAGVDTLNFQNATAGIILNAASGTIQNNGFGDSGGTFKNIDIIQGSAFDDTITVGNGTRVEAGAGDDRIVLLRGDHALAGHYDGGTGHNILDASALGNDVSTYLNLQTSAYMRYVNNVHINNDTFTNIREFHLGNGANQVIGSADNYTIHGGTGADTINMSHLNNDLIFKMSDGQTVNDGSGSWVMNLSSFESAMGGSGNDTFIGVNGAKIWGGGGNDTVYVTGGTNTLDGEAGTDTVSFEGLGQSVVMNISQHQGSSAVHQDGNLTTLYNFEHYHGSGANDTFNLNLDMAGLSGGYLIDGGLGMDTLNLLSGTFTSIMSLGTNGIALRGIETINTAAATNGTINFNANADMWQGIADKAINIVAGSSSLNINLEAFQGINAFREISVSETGRVLYSEGTGYTINLTHDSGTAPTIQAQANYSTSSSATVENSNASGQLVQASEAHLNLGYLGSAQSEAVVLLNTSYASINMGGGHDALVLSGANDTFDFSGLVNGQINGVDALHMNDKTVALRLSDIMSFLNQSDGATFHIRAQDGARLNIDLEGKGGTITGALNVQDLMSALETLTGEAASYSTAHDATTISIGATSTLVLDTLLFSSEAVVAV